MIETLKDLAVIHFVILSPSSDQGLRIWGGVFCTPRTATSKEPRLSLFVSFEGGEGSGKSTQVGILTERLEGTSFKVVSVREPGSTRLGWQVREWLKRGLASGEDMSAATELFLFAAARAEVVSKVVGPAHVEANTVIVADRFLDSSLAYQSFGRGVPRRYVDAVNELATNKLRPDLTLLLDCDPEEGLNRVGAFQLQLPMGAHVASESAERDAEGTRFEQESLDFHRRVRAGYRELAGAEPERWRILDASRPIDEISEMVWDAVATHVPGYQEAPAAGHSNGFGN